MAMEDICDDLGSLLLGLRELKQAIINGLNDESEISDKLDIQMKHVDESIQSQKSVSVDRNDHDSGMWAVCISHYIKLNLDSNDSALPGLTVLESSLDDVPSLTKSEEIPSQKSMNIKPFPSLRYLTISESNPDRTVYGLTLNDIPQSDRDLQTSNVENELSLSKTPPFTNLRYLTTSEFDSFKPERTIYGLAINELRHSERASQTWSVESIFSLSTMPPFSSHWSYYPRVWPVVTG